MSDPISSNDPLSPIYQNDPGALPPDKSIKGLTSKTNVMVLILIAAVILAVLAILGREKAPPEVAPPAATEIK